MKIVVVNGTEIKGVTYNMKEEFLREFKDKAEIIEYYLPKDMPHLCLGCKNCFFLGEDKCPHFEKVNPIWKSMEEADLLVFTSPIYAGSVSGGMKALLDHYSYNWHLHRSKAQMYGKRAVILTNSIGASNKTAIKEIKMSLSGWGVAEVKHLSIKLFGEVVWDKIKDKKKKKILNKAHNFSLRYKKLLVKCKPKRTPIKTKMFFTVAMMIQKKYRGTVDSNYSEQNGWFKKNRPWKK